MSRKLSFLEFVAGGLFIVTLIFIFIMDRYDQNAIWYAFLFFIITLIVFGMDDIQKKKKAQDGL